MPFKTAEERKAYNREWIKNHPEKAREYKQKGLAVRKLKYKTDPVYREKIKDQTLKKLREKLDYYQKRIRDIIISKGKCERCGFSDIRALIVHHPNGNKTSKSPYRTYKDIVENKVSYEVICMNCHVIHHGTLQNTRHWGGEKL